MGSIGALQISVVEGRNLKPKVPGGTADPYVVLELGKERARTEAVKGTLAPKWLKDFKLSVSAETASLVVAVVDDDRYFSSEAPIGTAVIALTEIVSAGTMVHWYRLKDAAGADAGEICLVLRYIKPKDIGNGNGIVSPSKLESSLSSRGANGASGLYVPDSKPTSNQQAATPPAIFAPVSPSSTGKSITVGAKVAPAAAAASGKSGGSVKSGGQKENVVTVAAAKKVPDAKKPNPSNALFAIGGAMLAVLLASMALSTKRRPGPRFHRVERGDTLCSIAGCYGVNLDDVVESNAELGEDPDRIYVGDRIFIPY